MKDGAMQGRGRMIAFAVLLALVLAPARGAPLAAQGAVAAAPAPTSAQRIAAAKAATTAVAFAEQFTPLMTSGDFDGASQLMHPRALGAIRRLVMTLTKDDAEVRSQMLGVESAAKEAALSDAAVFAKFLTTTMGSRPGLLDAMKGATTTVIGAVPEGDGTAHVVYRVVMSVEDMSIAQMSILSVQRVDGGWRALLTADLENLVTRMEAMRP